MNKTRLDGSRPREERKREKEQSERDYQNVKKVKTKVQDG